MILYRLLRGISAAGSAPHWQCGGQRFESAMLHNQRTNSNRAILVRIFLCLLHNQRTNSNQRILVRIFCGLLHGPGSQGIRLPGFALFGAKRILHSSANMKRQRTRALRQPAAPQTIGPDCSLLPRHTFQRKDSFAAHSPRLYTDPPGRRLSSPAPGGHR